MRTIERDKIMTGFMMLIGMVFMHIGIILVTTALLRKFNAID